MDVSNWSKWAAIGCVIHCAIPTVYSAVSIGAAVVHDHHDHHHSSQSHFTMWGVFELGLIAVVLAGLLIIMIRAFRRGEHRVVLMGMVLVIGNILVPSLLPHGFQLIPMLLAAPYLHWAGQRPCAQDGCHTH